MRALIINCSPVRGGATAAVTETVLQQLSARFDVESVCIDDYHIQFCRGCRSCHSTAVCPIADDVPALLDALDRADVIVAVSPSYWADVPGQFKAFIDRCTPWCNTHEPHASLRPGKRGYVIALRTGPGMRECLRIVETLEHFYGHMEIAACGHLGLCGVETREAVFPRREEILAFCSQIT